MQHPMQMPFALPLLASEPAEPAQWPTMRTVAAFIVIAVAAASIAEYGRRVFRLPLITGYILAGIMCGPCVPPPPPPPPPPPHAVGHARPSTRWRCATTTRHRVSAARLTPAAVPSQAHSL